MNSYLVIGIPILIILLIILLIIAYIVLYNRLNRLRIKVEEAGADIDVALEKRFDLLSEEIEAVKKYLSHEYRIMTDLTAARVGADLEEKRMAQQQEISEEVLKSIDQEIARQTRAMEQIRGKLGSIQRRIRRRSGMREEDPTRQETLVQVEERRGAALSQKVGALAGVHRDLSSVGAGINGLAEQYPILNSWVSMDHFQRSIYDSEEHLQAARRLYNANVSMYNQTLASIPWSIVASICRMEKAAFYEVEERKRDFQVNFD